jgi:large subunit ribosomal protein L29
MKSSETKLLSVEDLQDKLVESKKQLSDLRLNHAVSPLENPMKIKNVRRTVARILTEIAAKQ